MMLSITCYLFALTEFIGRAFTDYSSESITLCCEGDKVARMPNFHEYLPANVHIN
jgi:hypothetical protein